MIVVEVDLSSAMRKLHAMDDAVTPSAFLNAVGEAQLGWIARNFETSGGLVGGWRPLSPNTIAGRRKGSSAILQDTGRLRMAFGKEIAGNELRVGTGVRAGTNVKYASAHEGGVSAGKINPILPKNLRVEERIIRGRPRKVIVGVLTFMTAHGRRFAHAVRGHPGIPQRRMLPRDVDVWGMAQKLITARMAQINAMGDTK